jgi:inner membrane transporter RhtA
MVFLGETLTLTQTLALCSIIAASMGSTLTMRPKPKVEKVDIN